jgi:hypothetical protein
MALKRNKMSYFNDEFELTNIAKVSQFEEKKT